MKLTFSTTPDKEKILRSLQGILKQNTLLTLATLKEGKPYCNTAYYVFNRKFTLFFWSDTAARHSRNIEKSRHVAVTIFDCAQRWGSHLQGIQAQGRASKVSAKELITAGLLYMQRYPKVMTLIKNPRDFHSKVFKSRLYKIELSYIKLFDEKTFGKEEWREVFIQR